MKYVHLLPVAVAPCDLDAPVNAQLDVRTELQYGVLKPERTVVRTAHPQSRLLIGGTRDSRYGWVVAMGCINLFQDVKIVFDWRLDIEGRSERCTHYLRLRLADDPRRTRPLWSMDDVIAQEKEGVVGYPSRHSPVSFFPSSLPVALAPRNVRVIVSEARAILTEDLTIRPIEHPEPRAPSHPPARRTMPKRSRGSSGSAIMSRSR